MSASRALIVLLLTLASPALYAADQSEDQCDGEGAEIFMASKAGQRIEAQARTQISQAEQKEQAGNARAAYDILRKVSSCISEASHKRVQVLATRLEKKLGAEEEKNSHLKEAFDWFVKSESTDDADRVMLKRAQAQPEDRATFSTAFDYFGGHKVPASLKILRAIAVHNAKQLLAAEEKQYASHLDTVELLGKAKDWLVYAEAPDNRLATERAEKRGDDRGADTTREFLRMAISYYDLAGKPEKAKSVRDKAKKLGDEAARKNQGEVAAEYYQIAGLHDQARDLEKRTEAKHKADEGARQKQFKKDQDALEKELGM